MKKILLVAALVGVASLATSCGQADGMRKGSKSNYDSLSYAIGCDVAYNMTQSLADLPLDYEKMLKGVEESALDKSSLKHDDAVAYLQDYFMNKRMVRAQEIAMKRAEADSIRLASGDSTRVDYEADPAMFASEAERDSVSYALGNDIGTSLRESGLPIHLVWLLAGFKMAHDDKEHVNMMEQSHYLQYYFNEKMPADNKAASEAWLAKVEKKRGVQKTESGLLYRIDKAGDPEVMATSGNDRVKVHYTGRTRKGKVFDSSIFANRPKEQQEMLKERRPDDYDKDEPIEFPLNGVIRGWTEGMQLVGKGGKITLWIPSSLAYGPRGAGRDIGPNEALEFEVELIDVIPFEQPAPAEEEPAAEE